MTVLTKKQMKEYRADSLRDGKPVVVIAKVRHDDTCGNGHNTFSITGDFYGKDGCRADGVVKHKNGRSVYLESSGCIHEAIAKYIPELAPLLKFHLCSTDGPMHYVANTVYQAGETDCNGNTPTTQRQIRNGKTGKLVWQLKDVPTNRLVDADTRPRSVTLEWEPCVHDTHGKVRELEAARSSAVWPDATDDDLTAPGLQERLEARLPALMVEFQAAVEYLGLVY